MDKNEIMKSPSFQETSDLLKVHIQKKHRTKRRSPIPPQPMTKQDVREEASRILEQFLMKELEQNKGKHVYRKPVIGTAYQKVRDEDVTEEEHYLNSSHHSHKTPDSSSDLQHSYGASSHAGVIHSRGPSELSHSSVNSAKSPSVIHSRETSELSRTSEKSGKASIHSLLADNHEIPYADGCELGPRAKSLPPNLSPAHRIDNTMTTSYSLSPSKLENLDKSKGKNDLMFLSKDKGRQPRHMNGETSPITRGRRRYRSGSISSSDTETDNDVVSPDRKKKSVFKRAKERLNSVLNRSKDRKSEDKLGGKESPTKPGKSKSNVGGGNEAQLLSERHTHKHGHVEQHHYKDGKRTGVVRSEEVWESTDITDQENKKCKHIDKHSNVKESADVSTSEGGFLSNLRRFASRKSKKDTKKIPGSKSADFNQAKKKRSKKPYNRNISVPDGRNKDQSKHQVPDGQDEGKSNDHFESSLFEMDGRRTKHTTEVMTRDDADLNGQTDISNVQRSEPVDIDRRGLHTNQSFAVDYDIDETEYRSRLPTGEIDKELKHSYHQHSIATDDLDVDGNSPSEDEDHLPGPSHAGRAPTQEEKEKLYGIIAERLAEMGDSYMDGAQAASPRRPSAQASSSLEASYDVRDGDGLNALERELRDSLRNFGDNFSTEHPVSYEATEAAVDIVKQVTYSTFTDTVKKAIGEDVGWDQLAMLFYVTKKTVKAAGAGGAVALKVKEMSLRYLEDKFAGWIVDQGGFDSVLESESTDSELD